jgi:16S rRNA (uracil1498-N3)-methyltransferase|tara:strand:- start:1104 stop:1805 length:702 start_codon:yes stop_codon:yes gene_type:complete
MPNIRLFLEEKIVDSESIILDSKNIHYLKRVMRKKNGDKITIFNGKEQWEGKLNLSEATVKPERKTGFLEFVPDIHLYFSLLKNKQMNFLIEKVCEIGVKKIIPIKTEFSENFNLNINRLKKIAIEAVEQSDGIFVPEIEKVTPLTDVLKKWDDNRKIFFCDEDREGKRISKQKIKKQDSFALFIGPVGGWSLKDKTNFESLKINKINLGKNILKADTAAIVCLSGLRDLIDE